ncbi:MAG TPA: glycosyltransferase family 4 protein [Gemmatimonadaceae bacterium]|nr:glycosyltransferase family 4 protein [Gemmatimonadaceae bacterium]
MSSPRPRILHLDAGREWRGGQRQVLLLADGLRARGYEPLVVGSPGSPLVERLRARGIAASTIRMRSDWDLVAARRLRALMRTWRPDVVHAHDARSHAIALAALFARRGLTVPLVVTRRVPFPPRGVRLKYGPRVAHFIAISGAVRDAMLTAGVAAERIDVVHSGVPAPAADIEARDWRAERGWPADSVVCGVVGAMSAEKGVATLTAVGERLPPAVRDRVRLVLLGGAPKGAGPARGDEIVGGVRAYRAGFVDAVHEATAGLDVLWHPSRAEGLGTAVIDAMALGVPPVAFAVGGLPELIEPGRSGLLAPAGDVDAFAREAARLVEDATLRRTLGAGARDRARVFDATKMVDGVERVYARVLAATAATR